MNILFVNAFYYPHMIGGAEHSIKILCENLVLTGHNVAVFCIDSEQDAISEETINGVKVFRGTGGSYDMTVKLGRKDFIQKIKNRIYGFCNTSIIKELDIVLDKFNPTIVHTNNINGISPFIWKYMHLKGIPIIHTLRDYWLLSPRFDLSFENKKGLAHVPYIMYRKLMGKNTKYVSCVTGPSDFIVNKFRDYHFFRNANSTRVVNCVNIDSQKVGFQLKKKEKSFEPIIHFLFVGYLDRTKGIDILLKAFDEYENGNVDLTVCGSGPLEGLVNSYCEKDKRITYLGQLQSTRLSVEYDRCDVLVVPSTWAEPFGRVVIEANLHGMVVIGSNSGGIPEIIHNMKSGELFDVNDRGELIKKLGYFSKRDNIKSQLPNIIENINQYSSGKQVSSFLEIYKKLIQGVS